MSEYFISSQIARNISDHLDKDGIDYSDILLNLKIKAWQLADYDEMIPLRSFVAFFEEAAILAGESHFGLKAARSETKDSLGPLSFLFLSAPTLAIAFEGFTNYLYAMQQGTSHRIMVKKNHAIIEYQIMDDNISPRRQDSEYSIAATLKLVRNYLGCPVKPIEIHFEHSRIGSYNYYKEYFNCDVLFDQATNRILFPEDLLNKGSPQMSSRLYPIIADHLRSFNPVRDNATCVDQILQILTPARLENPPNVDSIAATLGLSPSTLLRRLREEETGYRELLMNRRMEVAARLLREANISISEISFAVGYSENASFSRAFKKHYHTTPAQYRLANYIK